MENLTKTLIIISLGMLIALEAQRFYFVNAVHDAAPLQRCPAPVKPVKPAITPHGDNMNDDNVVLPLEITL